ncbi:Hypothetical protein A7982_11673 [Minicystis rosea]|nr:Hypothetical protein A7982_11673 [Minicystis rosea]
MSAAWPACVDDGLGSSLGWLFLIPSAPSSYARERDGRGPPCASTPYLRRAPRSCPWPSSDTVLRS